MGVKVAAIVRAPRDRTPVRTDEHGGPVAGTLSLPVNLCVLPDPPLARKSGE